MNTNKLNGLTLMQCEMLIMGLVNVTDIFQGKNVVQSVKDDHDYLLKQLMSIQQYLKDKDTKQNV